MTPPVGGHLGVKKTLEKVQMRFYWPSQKKDVEKWCASCAKCSSRKSPLPPRAPLQLEDSVSRLQLEDSLHSGGGRLFHQVEGGVSNEGHGSANSRLYPG